MSIRYLRDKQRYRFEFEATVCGQRVRATKLLPAAWSKEQADKFDKSESARLYAEETGIQSARHTIDKAVVVYGMERCPDLKNGKSVIAEFQRFQDAYAGRTIDELAEVAKEYTALARSQGYAPATIRNRLAYLRAACRYGWRKHGMGTDDPAARLQMPMVKNERHYYATRGEVLLIARGITSRPARIALWAAYFSGMRLGEVLRCKVIGGCFLLEDTKNGDRRAIPVHPRLKHLLADFPLQITKRAVQAQFAKARAKVGMQHLHFHDLRHSSASEMINSGATLYEVGAVLGHRSAQSTKRYAHLATDTLAAAVSLIGRKSRTAK
jgi:integrase